MEQPQTSRPASFSGRAAFLQQLSMNSTKCGAFTHRNRVNSRCEVDLAEATKAPLSAHA
jgi:hypothetical protein